MLVFKGYIIHGWHKRLDCKRTAYLVYLTHLRHWYRVCQYRFLVIVEERLLTELSAVAVCVATVLMKTVAAVVVFVVVAVLAGWYLHLPKMKKIDLHRPSNSQVLVVSPWIKFLIRLKDERESLYRISTTTGLKRKWLGTWKLTSELKFLMAYKNYSNFSRSASWKMDGPSPMERCRFSLNTGYLVNGMRILFEIWIEESYVSYLRNDAKGHRVFLDESSSSGRSNQSLFYNYVQGLREQIAYQWFVFSNN